ncbi:UAA transporter family protein [Rhizoctonia solani AG-3 Rhs1AP]|uniref:UAA transporter family protein n=1 Tax=Rhizoctonia solani AG-3 Rhs1AP TaxID=1086054 RepID=X8JTI2_9AGAM|nr:UAA transporter family protein [Rhizoctonia solani AG-3 Rhs1AP]
MSQHEPPNSSIVTSIVYSSVKQWVIILTLIFGGCCSNALALEYTASYNPHAGSLITFTQFLLVAIVGLRHRLYLAPFQPRDWDSLIDEIARALLRERKSRTGGEHTKVGIQSQNEEQGQRFNRDVAERIRTLSPVTVIRASESAFTRDGGTLDQEALVSGLLHPLAPNGTQKYVTRVYDRDTGPRVLPTATRKSILLFDGQSLESARLAPYWDLFILLDSGSETPSGESKITRNSPTDSRPRIVVGQASGEKPRIEWKNVEVPMPLFVQLFRLRFRPLKIPLSRWIVQVVLFLVTSLLNNAAFKYRIPMAVHIIFRSAGLVVNLLLGLTLGKKYARNQILSVILVTAGVALSTASSLSHKRPKYISDGDFHTTSFTQDHLIGLSLLTLALVLSSLMGLAQERTYAQFGRHWQEGMFYLHFLALPMFALPGIGGDLVQQVKIANASPPVTIAGHVQNLVGSPVFRPAGPLGARPVGLFYPILERIMAFPLFSITLPSFYVPLAVNVFTQFLCVGGVHRLTSQVSSLTVTLVLVVRKAVSLWISVVLVGGNRGDVWLWGGAMAVVLGTVLYSLDQGRPGEKIKEKEL